MPLSAPQSANAPLDAWFSYWFPNAPRPGPNWRTYFEDFAQAHRFDYESYGSVGGAPALDLGTVRQANVSGSDEFGMAAFRTDGNALNDFSRFYNPSNSPGTPCNLVQAFAGSGVGPPSTAHQDAQFGVTWRVATANPNIGFAVGISSNTEVGGAGATDFVLAPNAGGAATLLVRRPTGAAQAVVAELYENGGTLLASVELMGSAVTQSGLPHSFLCTHFKATDLWQFHFDGALVLTFVDDVFLTGCGTPFVQVNQDGVAARQLLLDALYVGQDVTQ